MPQTLINSFLNIIYPNKCLVCQTLLSQSATFNLLCKSCYEKITPNPAPFCQKCGLGGQKRSSTDCPVCKNRDFSFDRAFSACIYDEPLKTLIHLFKYNSKFKLKKLFVSLLLQFIADYHLNTEVFDYLLPVPMHPSRLREREINHSQILADELSLYLKIPVIADNLIRRRQDRLQTELKFNERICNVKGAFELKDKEVFRNKNILIIDDVFTTGSTVSEISSLLKENSSPKVNVLTLARTYQEQN
ncbi:MAG: ComF family protein [Candidatus Omnitrophota bacterium]